MFWRIFNHLLLLNSLICFLFLPSFVALNKIHSILHSKISCCIIINFRFLIFLVSSRAEAAVGVVLGCGCHVVTLMKSSWSFFFFYWFLLDLLISIPTILYGGSSSSRTDWIVCGGSDNIVVNHIISSLTTVTSSNLVLVGIFVHVGKNDDDEIISWQRKKKKGISILFGSIHSKKR